jgi:rhodanese-related sulfurtransferase
LVADPEAVLIDVRTRAEWAYVGGPDLSSLKRPVIQVEWQQFPNGTLAGSRRVVG